MILLVLILLALVLLLLFLHIQLDAEVADLGERVREMGRAMVRDQLLRNTPGKKHARPHE